MNALEIKILRKKLKMTQDELGKAIGVSRGTIVNYEKGEVIPTTKTDILNSLLTNFLKKTNSIKRVTTSDLLAEKDKLLEEKDKLLAEKDKLLATQQEIIALLKNNK